MPYEDEAELRKTSAFPSATWERGKPVLTLGDVVVHGCCAANTPNENKISYRGGMARLVRKHEA